MRRLVVTTVVLAALAAPPAAVATFVPGPNGKLTFTSGRDGAPGNDDAARIWVADYPFGMPAQATTVPAGQHRHPSWSPDHTRIVYAAGPAFTGPYALWIKDLTDGSSFEFVAAAPKQDRPSWSPDGTQIAYGSNGDLWVKSVDPPTSTPVQLTNTAGVDEERPVWSPDGDTLYYNRGAAGNRDLYEKSPVTLAGAETPVLATATDDWQPALSPDGQRLCYLRGPQSNGATLRTIDVDGSGDALFTSNAPTLGSLNCVWAPDGTRIVYTLGAFGAGDLASRNVNGGDFTLLTSMNVAQHFDGNADWATNFSPTCEDRAADVGFNGFAAVTLACTDPDSGAGIAPPTPEGLGANDLEIATPPAHGVLGSISDSGSVIYTPDKDFQGSDSFTYTGSDGASDADPATVAVTIAGPGGPGGPGADTTPPEISDLSVSPRRWRRGSALPAAAQAAVGTTIAFRLSEAAEATLRFRRARPGRRAGGKCVKPTRRNRARKRCRRYVATGRLTRPAAAGLTRLRFEGRLSSAKRLKRGRHRLVIAAEDPAGNRATSPPLVFTIVR